MNEEIRRLWSQTKVFVWPQTYALVSLSHEALAVVVPIFAASTDRFAALVVESDEVSLTIDERLWDELTKSGARAIAVASPYRVITLQLNIDLGVTGYLLEAAARLAEGGISIVPQCAYLKDHLLIRSEQADLAVKILQALVDESASIG